MKPSVPHFVELLSAMTEKELKTRYKYTIFGFFWLVANPLLQMIIIFFVFSFFMKEPIAHYEYYLFVGLLMWNFFSLSLTKATPCIVHDRSLIKKAKFPRAVIPVSIVLSNFIHFSLALILLSIPTGLIGLLDIHKIPAVFMSLLLLLSFTVGLSLLTSALNVRFRDVNFFVEAILIIWFYATPIVYSLAILPMNAAGIWLLNPLTSCVQFLQSGFAGGLGPTNLMFLVNLVEIISVVILGVAVFRSESKNFDDWV